MPKILIVDDDHRMQREVHDALKPAGHDIMPVANGLVALARACLVTPDLIVSDVVMPVMDGWTLLARVREHTRLAHVPFILLTSKNVNTDLQRGFRLGADDYLQKPFDPAELVLRADRLLTRGRGKTTSPADEPAPLGVGLTGDLADFSLNSLLVCFASERKTGTIVVRDGRTRGRVFIRNGHVVGARIDHGPELRNADAIYWLLRWTAGRFEFRASAVEMADEVRAPTSYLVLEAARRLDEERHRAAAS
jgi:CheY-like chemotaxis protein